MLPETRVWLAFGIIMGLAMLTWLPALLGALTTYLVDRFIIRRRRDRAAGGPEN